MSGIYNKKNIKINETLRILFKKFKTTFLQHITPIFLDLPPDMYGGRANNGESRASRFATRALTLDQNSMRPSEDQWFDVTTPGRAPNYGELSKSSKPQCIPGDSRR